MKRHLPVGLSAPDRASAPRPAPRRAARRGALSSPTRPALPGKGRAVPPVAAGATTGGGPTPLVLECERDREPSPVCQCGATCNCGAECWCRATHGGTSGGTSSGSTSAATTGSTSGGTAGATSGATGSSGGTTGTPPGPTTGTDGGATSASTTGSSGSTTGSTGSTGSTTGSTGTSTGTSTGGDTTAGSTGSTAGSGGWNVSADGIAVEGVAQGGYVSGTKVEASFALRLRRPADGSIYGSAVVKAVEIKIGGEVDSAIPFAVPTANGANIVALAPGASGEYAVRVRFASTRFLDAKTINLNATFRYELQNDQGDRRSNLANTLKTFPVVAYNKGLALATKQWWFGGKPAKGNDPAIPPYYVYANGDDDPKEPRYDWTSQKAVVGSNDPGVAPAQLKAMNHTLVGSPDGVMDKVEIKASLATMTAFFAFTHGETDGFLDSDGGGNDVLNRGKLVYGTPNDGWKTEVGKAVWGTPPNRTLPRPNLVVLHACSGLASWLRTMQAFGLAPTTGAPPEPNRAYTGFPEVVMSRLFNFTYVQDSLQPNTPDDDPLWYAPNPGKPYLHDHAKLVYKSLSEGMTLGQALTVANNTYQPARIVTNNLGISSKGPMTMQVFGDRNARLVSVWTGDERSPIRPPIEQGPGRYPYRWYSVNP